MQITELMSRGESIGITVSNALQLLLHCPLLTPPRKYMGIIRRKSPFFSSYNVLSIPYQLGARLPQYCHFVASVSCAHAQAQSRYLAKSRPDPAMRNPLERAC